MPVRTALIIGTGPAAAGAALALSREPDLAITVIDIGLRLDTTNQSALDVLARSGPAAWDGQALRITTAQPIRTKARGLPQKLSYGSDFPYRDVGQLGGVHTAPTVNDAIISAAYGGFSNVWGSQIMPFTAATFRTWPVNMSRMEPHYRAILGEIPFAGEVDDLAEMFPLLGRPAPLPEPSTRTARVLKAYARHRPAVRGIGVSVGKARLALQAEDCVKCGLCMTGCPYSLIYSAAHTFDKLRRSGRVVYYDELLAVKVQEDSGEAVVIAKDLNTGQLHRFRADALFVACGAIGTTRLVANSLDLFDVDIGMQESRQFTVPMLSGRPTPDPRTEAMFTLNQFNMVIELGRDSADVSQVHFYTYDPSFVRAIPRLFGREWPEPVVRQVLRHLSVGLGYLPSWHSPGFRVRAQRAPDQTSLPSLTIAADDGSAGNGQLLRYPG